MSLGSREFYRSSFVDFETVFVSFIDVEVCVYDARNSNAERNDEEEQKIEKKG